jgi:hypothetical protein
MSRGFVYFAEKSAEFSFVKLVESFKENGIQLKNEWTKNITRLSDEGDQIPVSEEELSNYFKNWDCFTFQLWFSDDTDMCCSFRRLSKEILIHEYSFDGLSSAECERAGKWAVDRFKKKSMDENIILLIVDYKGISGEYDWDGFIRTDVSNPNIFPEIIGVNTNVKTLALEASTYDRYSLDHSVLFTRRL